MPYLTIKEVADRFGVSSKTIYRLLNKGELPALKVGGQWRFDLRELERRFKVGGGEPGPLLKSFSPSLLSRALSRGGVFSGVPGVDLREVVGNCLALFDLPAVVKEKVAEAILEREELCATSVGRGVAVPHPRYPHEFSFPRSRVCLCILRGRLDLQALDGAPVDKLFFIFSRSEREHLQIMKQLALSIQRDEFVRALRAGVSAGELTALLDGLEKGAG